MPYRLNKWFDPEKVVDEMVCLSTSLSDWQDADRKDNGLWDKVALRLVPSRRARGKSQPRDRFLLQEGFRSNRAEVKDKFLSRTGAKVADLEPTHTSTPMERYCVCRKPHDESDPSMVQCNECENWFHAICVRISIDKVSKDPTYLCPFCSGNERRVFPGRWADSISLDPLNLEDISGISLSGRPMLNQNGSINTSVFNSFLNLTTSLSPMSPNEELGCRGSSKKISSLYQLTNFSEDVDTSHPDDSAFDDGVNDNSDSIKSPTDQLNNDTEHLNSDLATEKDGQDSSTTDTNPNEVPSGGESDDEVRPVPSLDLINCLPVIPDARITFNIKWVAWKKYLTRNGPTYCLKEGWTDLVYKHFNKKNPYCVLVFKRKVFTPFADNAYLHASGHCKHPNCINFKISVRDVKVGHPVEFVFQVTSGQYFHDQNDCLSRRLQYQERAAVRRKLRHRRGAEVATELHKKADMIGVSCGNLTSRPKRDVIRVIRNEELKSKDFHKDPIFDILLNKRDEMKTGDVFLRMIMGDSLQVLFFSEGQVEILRSLLKNKCRVVAHIDATGSLIRKIPGIGGKKSILLYSMSVVNPERRSPPIALCEFITNTHDQDTVEHCLKQFWKCVTKKLSSEVGIFTRIETDFSRAIIYGCLTTFGGRDMDIRKYLNHCFKELMEKVEPYHINFHVCRIHMINTIKHAVATSYKNAPHTHGPLRTLLNSFLYSKTLGECHFYITKVFRICLSQYHTTQLDLDLANIRDLPGLDYDVWKIDAAAIYGNTSPVFDTDAIYKCTYFGVLFSDLKQSVEADLGSDGTNKNDFFNKAFCKYLITDILPYTPMITHVMFSLRDDDEHHFDHNNPAEMWNRIIKIDEHGKKNGIKIGRFIRASKEMMKGRVNDFQASMKTFVSKSNKRKGEHDLPTPKRKKVKVDPKKLFEPATPEAERSGSTSMREEADDEVEEGWNRKGRPVASRRFVGAVFDRLPFVPWGSAKDDPIAVVLSNTCPLDNTLMILLFLVECYTDVRKFFGRDDLPDNDKRIRILEVLDLLRQQKFNQAKLQWLLHIKQSPRVKAAVHRRRPTTISMYGTESSQVHDPLQSMLKVFDEIHTCYRHGSRRIPVALNQYSDARIEKIVDRWNGINPYGKCGNKGCREEVECVLACQSEYDPVPFITFSLPLVVDAKMQTYGDIPDVVNVCSHSYKLVACVLNSKDHFFTIFRHEGKEWKYDGQDDHVIRLRGYSDNTARVSSAWYHITGESK